MSVAGLVYLLCAPGYGQVKAEFDAIRSVESLADYIVRTRQQPYPAIYWSNGSVVAFRSLDRPDLLREEMARRGLPLPRATPVQP
jgi:hypothetical protein